MASTDLPPIMIEIHGQAWGFYGHDWHYIFLFTRDAICEALTLGFWVEFLLNLVKDLARAVFGARAIHNIESFFGPDEIRAVANALNLKQCEVENQHGELRALLFAQVFLLTVLTVWQKQ
ncbi:hypothetical protein L3X38_032439 [Prunus dulcis]|uniref:Uncharacterized protein n=1 Tax=Prunus dulcis TaxID=3755 RepID=A0AAD4VFR5_PRUDU|nr:hypothetical protein L3X38_032439 [Prunus dulcis]